MDRDPDYYGDVTVARYKKENETLRRLLGEANGKLVDYAAYTSTLIQLKEDLKTRLARTNAKLLECEKLLSESMELHAKRKGR